MADRSADEIRKEIAAERKALEDDLAAVTWQAALAGDRVGYGDGDRSRGSPLLRS